MEHSTSAVNWQPRNVAKVPGEMARNSLSHFGRGADAILFFQWRASRSGAEKFHSAMLPHAGTDSRVWREVVELGAALGKLDAVKGSQVVADVALLYDLESIWAQELEWRPSKDMLGRERIRAYYERLWRDGVTVDLAHPSADLSAYKLVVAPASYLLSKADADNLTRYVEQGGTLVVSCFSAIVDEHDAVHEGGFVAPLREALGLMVEEFLPLREGVTVTAMFDDGTELTPSVWQEDIRLEGADGHRDALERARSRRGGRHPQRARRRARLVRRHRARRRRSQARARPRVSGRRNSGVGPAGARGGHHAPRGRTKIL